MKIRAGQRVKRKFPKTLRLLPGLRWKGKLVVLACTEGRYLVQFDAEEVDPVSWARFVYDRTELSPVQLRRWTGWPATENEGT